MQNVTSLIKEVALATLAGSRYTGYKYFIRQGEITCNMLGGEATPQADKGVILAHTEGWYIQKIGVNKFVAHLASLIPVELKVGDKVEIQHGGFKGTSQKEGKEEGMQFRSVTLSVARLKSPVNHSHLNDMTEQLSETRLPDGRRGLHMLSDLQYKNFRGDANTALSFNPYLEFEVAGGKFVGTVRFELVLGMDMYKLSFTAGDGSVTVVENVTFDETVKVIEEHCDSSHARLATVTVLSRAKVPKAHKAEQPTQSL